MTQTDQVLEPGAAVLARPTNFWNTTFASMSETAYAWFFTSHILVSMGMQMQFILFGFLAYELTGSSKSIGLVSIAGAIPTIFLGALGGALADRLDKRLLVATAQISASLTMGALAFLIISGSIEFWHLMVGSLVMASITSINMPARQALVPFLVPRHKLMNAISLQMGGMNLTSIIAPALAGFLIGPLGAGAVLVMSALLFFSGTVATLRLPIHGMTIEREQRSVLHDLHEGFSYIWHQPTLRLLLTVNIVMPMLVFPARQMLPVFAREVFEMGPGGLGLLAAMSGVGGLFGAVLSANLSGQPQKGRLMLIGSISMAVFTLLFALSPAIEPALFFIAASSTGQMIMMTTNSSVIQAILPSAMRGRVSAVTFMSFGLTPLAVFPVSIAADSFGAPATIAVASVLMMVLILLFFAVSPRLRSMRQDALVHSEMSEVQAAGLQARGEISREQAAALSGTVILQPDPIRPSQT